MFTYPISAHRRRHGPRGYTDYTSFKDWLRDDFSFRCVFCLLRETWVPLGSAVFSVEHVVPKADEPSRECDYTNLTYACVRCNSLKGTTRIADPCAIAFGDHLTVNDDGIVEAATPDGRDLVDVLRLNRADAIAWRAERLAVARVIASAPPSPDKDAVFQALRGYPADLPDLSACRPPGGNARPDGIPESALALRQAGCLPPSY